MAVISTFTTLVIIKYVDILPIECFMGFIWFLVKLLCDWTGSGKLTPWKLNTKIVIFGNIYLLY